eukprot:s805_g3.t1
MHLAQHWKFHSPVGFCFRRNHMPHAVSESAGESAEHFSKLGRSLLIWSCSCFAAAGPSLLRSEAFAELSPFEVTVCYLGVQLGCKLGVFFHQSSTIYIPTYGAYQGVTHRIQCGGVLTGLLELLGTTTTKSRAK